jgi:2-keto-4-pentenoate hydratase
MQIAAARLRQARVSRLPCQPVRDRIAAGDIEAAYAVQSLNLDLDYAAGRQRVGRKIGLTSPAVQQQLGVDQPDFGTLLDDMVLPAGSRVPCDVLIQPKVEAEVAFWLDADLDMRISGADDVRVAVRGACAAIEIVDSRIAGWDISLVDTIADNASSALAVVSADVVSLDAFVPRDVQMTLAHNGTVASTGTGADCLGDPLIALAWLASAAQRLGDPLRAGELVLSGALGPMVTVSPGDQVYAQISGLGAIDVSFAGDETT